MAIDESKDLSSLALDELNGNLKVHEVVMETDSEIYRDKKERVKSIALKAKKESRNDETLTFRSDYEEYAMVVRNFKKFFRRKGKFVRQPREEKKVEVLMNWLSRVSSRLRCVVSWLRRDVSSRWRNNYPSNASNTQDNQGHKQRRDDPTHEPSVWKIRRFEMMKYSFNDNEEYIAIKESEYFNHSKENLDAYRELLVSLMRDGSWQHPNEKKV
nr:UBN2 domain-containing protein [Tanacetum cinerariifolium]